MLACLVGLADAGCPSGEDEAAATADGGAGGSGGGPAQGGNPGSAAGGVRGEIGAIPSASGCVYDGRSGPGGSDGVNCPTITVVFSPPLARDTPIELATDLYPRTAFKDGSGCWVPYPTLCAVPGEPTISKLSMVDREANQLNGSKPYPTSATVRVSRPGAAAVEKTFSDLHYRCVARTYDDWCWEADPVTFQVP